MDLVTGLKIRSSSALLGLRLEQRINGLLRVFDYQPFFFGSAFTFWCLLRHRMVLSSQFLDGYRVMPQPGIGPGRREWARGCKPRLSASSSTGAHGGDVGNRTRWASFADPFQQTCHPHQGGIQRRYPLRTPAQHLSSLDRSIEFERHYWPHILFLVIVEASPAHHLTVFVRDFCDFPLTRKPRQNRVSRSGNVLLRSYVETYRGQPSYNLLSGQRMDCCLHHCGASFGDPHRIDVRLLAALGSQSCDCATELSQLRSSTSDLRFSVGNNLRGMSVGILRRPKRCSISVCL